MIKFCLYVETGRLAVRKIIVRIYSFIIKVRRKGEPMKSILSLLCKMLLTILFCISVFLLTGCSSEQMGETTAEGQRRHQRNLRLNHQEMMADIDSFLLLDEPSRLSDKRIP